MRAYDEWPANFKSVDDGAKLIGSLEAKIARPQCDLFRRNIERHDIAERSDWVTRRCHQSSQHFCLRNVGEQCEIE